MSSIPLKVSSSVYFSCAFSSFAVSFKIIFFISNYFLSSVTSFFPFWLMLFFHLFYYILNFNRFIFLKYHFSFLNVYIIFNFNNLLFFIFMRILFSWTFRKNHFKIYLITSQTFFLCSCVVLKISFCEIF